MPRTKKFDQKKVLNKAMKLFWKKGYHATSMQDLVDHLGINRASIYDTYGGKRQLFDKALSLYSMSYTDDIASILNDENEVKTRFKILFLESIENLIKDKENKGCFIVNTSTELIPGDKAIESVIRDNQEAIQELFFQVLKRAEEHGEIKKGKDIKSISLFLFNLYSGIKVSMKTKPDKEEMLKSIDLIEDLL